MTETNVCLSLKRGIFPLETKAQNRTNAILYSAVTYTTGVIPDFDTSFPKTPVK
jgi:hypothetical protein